MLGGLEGSWIEVLKKSMKRIKCMLRFTSAGSGMQQAAAGSRQHQAVGSKGLVDVYIYI